MSFPQILDNYFLELKKEFSAAKSSGEATPELSFRTSLDNFFKNIAAHLDDKIITIPEPKNQNKMGRPDWRFHNSDSMGVYGYVEAKGIDPTNSINVTPYQKQVGKYISIGHPVILTDGVDFIFFTVNGECVEHSICQKPINWETPKLNYEIESLFNSFLGKIGYRTISEKQLVNEVAKRAKLLTDEISELLELEEDEAENKSERQTVSQLKELKNIAEISHDKSLTSPLVFSSFISQILTFGLLYAHRVIGSKCSTPGKKYLKIHDFWCSVINDEYTNKLLPFKTLVQLLNSELNSDLSKLGLWYDDLRRLLAHVKLTEKQIKRPDFHELYEAFLSQYDPKARFDYGAFYTPRVLAFYSVELAKSIITQSLPMVDLHSSNNKIIDPCCGTGTFIEALLKVIKPKADVKIIGFEILPAPYALAHYRMSIILKGYPDNIQIKLTNTLSDNIFELHPSESNEKEINNILFKEQEDVYHLATPPLTLIIGNPPSSDAKFQANNEGDKIKLLIDDFRPKAEDRTSRQNIQKQLSNEFIKFLRWTMEQVKTSTPSLFVLILPSSFAKHPSYKYARKYLLKNLNEMWVLDFDSDLRTGAENVNIFNTQQGRLLLAGVSSGSTKGYATVNYRTIVELTKQEKYTYFENPNISLDSWEQLETDEYDFSIRPKLNFDQDSYDSFWALSNKTDTGIFLRHCSSLKLAPTHLLVHASSGQLKRRSKYIAQNKNDYTKIKSDWYSGQRKPPPESKITENVKSKLAIAVKNKRIFDYSYRPFIETKVLLDIGLLTELRKLGGGGTRDRPEIRAAYANDKVFGFAVSPSPEDIGDKLHKFSSFCWNTPDNDLSKRGNAHVFCNYFPEYKKKNAWDSSCKDNLNPDIIGQIAAEFQMGNSESTDLLTFYCYGVLSSNCYLNTFKGALYSVSGNWPRIPISKVKTSFIEIANYGKVLAEIESGNFSISSKENDDTEIVYYKYNIVDNSINLKDKNGKIIKQYPNVERQVLDFEVSGYNVIKEWLKLHSYPYYRKALEKQEIIELETLMQKIILYSETIEELDLVIEKILLSDNLFCQNGD